MWGTFERLILFLRCYLRRLSQDKLEPATNLKIAQRFSSCAVATALCRRFDLRLDIASSIVPPGLVRVEAPIVYPVLKHWAIFRDFECLFSQPF